MAATMNGFYITAALSVFIFINLVNLSKQSVIELSANNDTDNNGTDGSYNITDGSCSVALATDMVFHEHVDKYFIPLVKRNATSTWYGDETIYCLIVMNAKDEETGGNAFVKAGGVGHHFVTIEMHSQSGEGMEFDVQVYAYLWNYRNDAV